MMVLPDDSWHIKYFEFSYFYYIGWTTVLVFIYSVYYCVRAPRSIGSLKDILEQDPIINDFEFSSEPAKKSQKIVFSSTSVPQHNLPQKREKTKTKEAPATAAKELKDNETPAVPIEKVRRTIRTILLNNSNPKQRLLLRQTWYS